MTRGYDKNLEDCVEGERVTRYDSGTFGECEVYFIVKIDSDGNKYLEETGHSRNLVDNR